MRVGRTGCAENEDDDQGSDVDGHVVGAGVGGFAGWLHDFVFTPPSQLV